MSGEARYVKITNNAAFVVTVYVVVVAFEEGSALLPTHLLGDVGDHDDKVFRLTDVAGLPSGAEFRVRIETPSGADAFDKTIVIFDKSDSIQANYDVGGVNNDPHIAFTGFSEFN